MARKSTKRAQPSHKTAKPRRARHGTSSAADLLIDAAFSLFAKKAWRHVTLSEIAAVAGMTVTEAATVFPNKGAITAAFFRRIDMTVAASGPASEGSARDRLFDVLMRRFDALSPQKSAVRTIVSGMATAPLFGLCTLPRFMASMARMLETAGIDTHGPSGQLRVKGLALIYANTIRVWFTDDTTDLGRTMAALNKGLAWAERGATFCPFGRREGRDTDAGVVT